MKRKFKNKLIVLLVALLSLFVLAGCTFSETLNDFIERQNIKVKITYHINGGHFNGVDSVESNILTEKSLDIYYLENAYPLNIAEATSNRVPNISNVPNATFTGSEFIYANRQDYILTGWCYKGAVIDEAQGLYETGADFDFSAPLVGLDKGLKEIELVAKWQKKVAVKVQLAQIIDEDMNEVDNAQIDVAIQGPNIDKTNIQDGEISFKKGDILGEFFYKNGYLTESGANPNEMLFAVKDKAYSFFDYYEDEACTTPINFGENGLASTPEDITIYARYLKGDWKFVTNAKEVEEMFEGSRANSDCLGKTRTQYWLKNNIDCSGVVLEPLQETVGTLKGNNYKLSNLKFFKDKITASRAFAIFGDITESAKLENVTFENLQIEYKGRNPSENNPIKPSFYMVFLSLHSQAQISNVHITGTMRIEIASKNPITIENMKNGLENCLYGGYANDEAYKTNSGNQGFIVYGDVNEFITLVL